MKEKIKKVIRATTPPFLFNAFKNIIRPKHFEYEGDFPNWTSALEKSEGYDNSIIFEKVKNARIKVMSGEKAYERDSVLFDEIQIFWPLLSTLLFVAAKNNGQLSVLDFGGSLGSTYFQNIFFLKKIPKLSWSIVEQKKFVDFGQTFITDPNLKFYETLNECLSLEKPNVALFSSTIQYVEKPFEILAEIKNRKIPNIIFDRTTFFQNAPNRITVQNPPKKIYASGFPARFFNLSQFKTFFEPDYKSVTEWTSIGDPIPFNDTTGRNMGILFELKEKS